MGRLLKVDQVAERLGLSAGMIRLMIRQGRLPVVRPTNSRAIRVPEDAVEALTRQTIGVAR
jgi:excisionase family DNA binding protein